MAEIIEVTKDNFESEIMQAEGTVLVDFWAVWCGPCRMIGPILKEIAAEDHADLKICKINVDEQPLLSQQYKILSIPTLIVFKDGKVVDQSVGVIPKPAILKLVGLS